MSPCPFCEIAAGHAPADIVREWPDTLAVVPLNPVTLGHLLVIPRTHVPDFTDDPVVTGLTAQRTAELARDLGLTAANEITSKGGAATQTVFHLHRHLVPRAPGDGLALPWTGQAA
ncbi:HIT family protein [Streptomyces reniochalinae]|uniref:HIT family protein n=1 Tax=Streptomyces reniochalinae TaxID=2250578 RepID=A0A367EUS3_9ACTN|nr:HIT family protein [Streptomyces reniochalinae]RCG21783.1 HIT family protein [Streptomyces reniochalinae]